MVSNLQEESAEPWSLGNVGVIYYMDIKFFFNVSTDLLYNNSILKMTVCSFQLNHFIPFNDSIYCYY